MCNAVLGVLVKRFIFFAAIFEIYFPYDKDVWIAATDFDMYFYLIVLSPLRGILQLKGL